jgi:ferredoxin
VTTPTRSSTPITRSLSQAALAALVADARRAGVTVIAPRRDPSGAVGYSPIEQASEVDTSGALPQRSLKQIFLPPSEPLFAYRLHHDDVELIEAPTRAAPRIVLAARPCDAAALEIVDRVMGWDYRDELWFGRRESTTVISLACAGVDRSCFCTAVGLGPDSRRGADWRLTPIAEGYLVEVLSERGERLAAQHEAHLGAARDDAAAAAFDERARTRVRANLELQPQRLRAWLETHFDDPFWTTAALRCHGCGACAALCPTCHCFDIVDEQEGVDRGTRRRHWDTCQTALFTLHGSGHNPRRDQSARYRQRINHKFGVYPKRFGEVLCTGCGRCVRACAGGMDLLEILGAIDRLAASSEDGGAA